MINTKSVQVVAVASVFVFAVFSPAALSAAGKIDKTGVDSAAQSYVRAIQSAQYTRLTSKLEGSAAATRVRKAFLKAKKAFHEARMDIQAIKKGDEDSRQGVPGFFESEDNEEEYQENEDELVASN